MGYVLDQKLGWESTENTDGKVIDMITALTLFGPIGSAAGSFLSEKIANKYGIWKTILAC